jgi:hypothetical protein
MRIRLKAPKKMAMALLITLFLLLQGAIGPSTLAAGQTATDKPISGKTTTVPAGKVAPGQRTTTTPLPSAAPAREYQQVDKPPAKKLDIPEYDLAGKLSEVRFKKRTKLYHNMDRILFKVSLKNHGTRRIPAGKLIPIRTRLINTGTDTIIYNKTNRMSNDDFNLKSEYWVEMPETTVRLKLGDPPAPETLNDLKLIVDVDPDNTYHEAQRHRGNNRCVATW